jgi:hypothetical protein
MNIKDMESKKLQNSVLSTGNGTYGFGQVPIQTPGKD